MCCGRLPGTVLSPYFLLFTLLIFSLNHWFPFFKYANDVVIGHPYRLSRGIFTINEPLKYVSGCSGENGLNFNPNECVKCMFFFKGSAFANSDLKATLNDNVLSTVTLATYPGDKVSNNTKWSTYVEEIVRKCVHLPLIVKKFRRLSTPAEFIRKFAEASALPIILCFSPAIFPWLLKYDFAQLSLSVMYVD